MQLGVNRETSKILTCVGCGYDLEEEESFSIEGPDKKMKKYCKLCYTTIMHSQLFGFVYQD
jgi:hypothetical protein